MNRAASVIFSVTIACAAANFASAQAPKWGNKPGSHILTPSTVVLTIPLGPDEAPLKITLSQLMDIYKDPGISVAVIDHNKIAWAKGFGFTEPGGGKLVTPTTLFQAASISKPITAAGALWLVEHGKVSLDEDVNLKLKTWKVPENEFTTTQKVTLRRLMSHNAGLNVHGFAGYAQGSALPTTEQTLDGIKPTNNPAIRVTVVPGTACIYSGGGVTIEGLLMHDVSGESFEDFMREHVLQPAGMTSSTFEQQLPPAFAARAAIGTRANGQAVPGKWHLYPELAPDGLWTTPTDLAKFAIEVALSRDGHANHILSQSMTKQMLTVQCHDTPGDIGGIALGFGIGYRNHPGLFRHTGGNDGFESILMMDADAGWGLAMMGNSDNFEHLENPLAQTLARAYGYDLTTSPTSLADKLVVVAAQRGIPAALAFYQREKTAPPEGTPLSPAALNTLGYYLLGQHRLNDAISVFSLNVSEYPADANTYDSLAEAYLDNGQRDLAIQNYQKSLDLNPKNDNAVEHLKKLRSQ